MTKATHPIPPESARAAGAGHETSDASVLGIVMFVAVMLGTIALLGVFIHHQLRGLCRQGPEVRRRSVAFRRKPPARRPSPVFSRNTRRTTACRTRTWPS